MCKVNLLVLIARVLLLSNAVTSDEASATAADEAKSSRLPPPHRDNTHILKQVPVPVIHHRDHDSHKNISSLKLAHYRDSDTPTSRRNISKLVAKEDMHRNITSLKAKSKLPRLSTIQINLLNATVSTANESTVGSNVSASAPPLQLPQSSENATVTAREVANNTSHSITDTDSQASAVKGEPQQQVQAPELAPVPVPVKAVAVSSKTLAEIAGKSYKSLIPCLKDSKFANGRDLATWKFPRDAEKHYKELLEKTKIYRNIKPHAGPGGFKGPWIENIFIDRFISKPLSYFGGLIPLFIQWTDVHVHSFDEPHERDPNVKIPDFKDMMKKIAELTRPDVIYLSINQDDQGLFNQLATERPNILSLSAGGFGHIPIPLIKGELNFTTPPKDYEWDLGFFGNLRPRLSRSKMLDEMQRVAKSSGMSVKYSQSSSWEKDIGKSKFNLAPRGFGRTSYRLAEVVQIGRIPVYLYDDASWLPYEGTNISLSTFGYSGHMGNLGPLAKQLKSVDKGEYQRKLEKVKEVRPYYTYAGLLHQLERFFSDPLGPDGGDLRCTRVPDKDHRRLAEPPVAVSDAADTATATTAISSTAAAAATGRDISD